MVTVALAIWPFIGAIFFAVLSPARALLATIFAGYLFLPSQGSFDLPLLPELDKDSIPALVSLLAIALIARKPSMKSINKPQSPDRAGRGGRRAGRVDPRVLHGGRGPPRPRRALAGPGGLLPARRGHGRRIARPRNADPAASGGRLRDPIWRLCHSARRIECPRAAF